MVNPAELAWRLHHDARGRLVLTDEAGCQHAGAQPVRAFPLSCPRDGVSICDAEGRELVWIDRLDDLPAELLRLLEEHLARREFVPVIRRIHTVSAAVEPSEWEVETDRGRTRFLLGTADDIHQLDDHTALFTDTHSIRYLLPDLRQLDAPSRRLLERFL